MNGNEHKVNFVTHEDLLKGISMEWTMVSKPDKQRGSSLDAAPYSFSKEYTPSKVKAKKNKKK